MITVAVGLTAYVPASLGELPPSWRMKMESAVTLAGTIGSLSVIWICAFCATPLELFAGTTVAVGAVVSGVGEALVANVVEKGAIRLPDRSRSPVSCTL